MWKEIMEQPDVIRNCAKKNAAVMEDIVREFEKRKIDSVYIAARGTSDHAAVYGKYVFEVAAGIPVALAAPSVFTVYNKTLKLKNAIVIGISQSGKAEDVLKVLQSANQCGALTVSITNYPDSPLAKAAQFHLDCTAGEEKSVAATKTFTSEMYLIGTLAASIAHDDKALEKYAGVPELIEETFGQADKIEKLAQKCSFINECIVLGRGFNYAVALEAALKIMETTYVRAKAFASSDFYHGPMAILQKGIPVFLYAPSGKMEENMVETLEKVESESGAPAFVITDEKSERIEKAADTVICIPRTGCDLISPFCCAAAAQMIACKLAQAKGLNPDKPHMLHKVTITH